MLPYNTVTKEVKRKLMKLTRSKLNPIGKLVYDFCEVMGETRKECLLTAVLAEDCFINLKQAEEWIRSKKEVV